MGPFSFHAKENGFCFLLMPSWLLMAPLIMEDDAGAEEEQDRSRAEDEADMKVAEEEIVLLRAMVEG
jgi:hypothetical protein